MAVSAPTQALIDKQIQMAIDSQAFSTAVGEADTKKQQAQLLLTSKQGELSRTMEMIKTSTNIATRSAQGS